MLESLDVANQALFVGVDDYLHAVAEFQLAEDPRDVTFDRRLGEVELTCNFAVRLALRDQIDDFLFTRAELISAGWVWPGGGRRQKSSMSRRVIDGARSWSPAVTARTAARSCSRPASLSAVLGDRVAHRDRASSTEDAAAARTPPRDTVCARTAHARAMNRRGHEPGGADSRT